MSSCKDPVTTNDPRQVIITTKVAVVAKATPAAAFNIGRGDTSIITITMYDTNQYGSVKIQSASVTGYDQKYFKIIDNTMFPLSLNPGDSASFGIRFFPADSGSIKDTLHLWADTSEGVNVNLPLNCNVSSTISPSGGILNLSDTTIDFGFVQIDSTEEKDITAKNIGTASITIRNIYFVGSDSVNFGCGIIPAQNVPFTIQPGNTITLRLHYTPYNLGAQSATLFITADNIQSNLVYLTGIGANNGMSIEPSQLKFSYFDSIVSNQIMFDTLYDFNLDTNIQYVDSIKVQTSTPADTSLFTVLGNFPVLIPAPSGPGKANGLRTPIAIIRFNGTNKVSPHYGYLQVYFRGAPMHPILVPLIAGPF